MSDIFIKNIPHEQITTLASQVEVQAGQVVSKTLAQNDALSITIFSFDKGEEIGTHGSSGDAMVTVLEGVGKFTVDGQEYVLKRGETLVMPANKPHSVYVKKHLNVGCGFSTNKIVKIETIGEEDSIFNVTANAI
ncbi:MAG: cupin domain-containing protein [Thomasclavelia ramosa]